MKKSVEYTEKEAELLDKSHKKLITGPIAREGPHAEEIYMKEVFNCVDSTTRLLDLCCGAGNFLHSLSATIPQGILAGIDMSPAMTKKARENTSSLSNVRIIQGDIAHLPFSNSTFHVVACHMAPAEISEVYKVLKPSGWFIHMGAGFTYNPQIKAVFKERYTFSPYKNLDEFSWKKNLLEEASEAGFRTVTVDDFTCTIYYRLGGLTEYLEMIPVVKEFDSEKDYPYLRKIAQKYNTSKGIRITRQYFILRAQK